MTLAVAALLTLAVAGLTLWLAVRSIAVTTFLCGAFFVSSGTLLYLHLAKVSVPVIGTGMVLSPQAHLFRASVHGLLCIACGVAAAVLTRRAAASGRADR